uniref:WRKY domain-containing protein n=1 Tax=Setaria viridis TaxID=4556 RepID=A0A4U6T2A5_SETVI|nr:hypothetical protein SEVIR_9G377000v2 [Setaria viridis]
MLQSGRGKNGAAATRYYYRRTYKDNMNCPATKQVQQKDHSDPPLYAVTYYNEHLCNSAFLTLSPSEFQLQTSSGKAISVFFDSSSGPAAQEPLSTAAAPTNASSGSPSSSAAAQRGTPPEISNPHVMRRSETYPWGTGAVEQKPASCSTKFHDAFTASAGVVPSGGRCRQIWVHQVIGEGSDPPHVCGVTEMFLASEQFYEKD